jgi:hypothetical protein
MIGHRDAFWSQSNEMQTAQLRSRSRTGSDRVIGSVETQGALERNPMMKGCLQFWVAVILHPVAAVLAWINIAGREDLNLVQKVLWAVVSTIWGIGPILYITLGGGSLW